MAVLEKLLAASPVLAVTVMIVFLLLRDRGASRSSATADRSEERAALTGIITNHIAHGTEATNRLAGSLDRLAEKIADCPARKK